MVAWQATQRRFREQLQQVQPFSLVILACAVGILTGCGAIAFVELITLVQWLALGSTDLPLHVLPQVPWYRVLVLPAVGGLLVAPLVYLVPREARGHGVPEVIETIIFKSGKIHPAIALIKALASALTIGTGGSVGREGPIVQIGAALGSTVGQVLRVPLSRLSTLAGCGVAGGIAAVFNAPIAGAFFALEVIMGNFAMPAFGPVMLASVLATVISRAYFGSHPAFIVPGYTPLGVWELPLYLVLGIVCGGAALTFMLVLDMLEKGFATLRVPKLLKPALGGLLLGALILVVPNLYGVGYATMDGILRGGVSWSWLLLLLPAKMLATSLTLASGGSGGLFLPCLYLGAVTGGLFGLGAGSLLPTPISPSGAFAVVGMGAFLSGAIHCPITAFLLLFEVTGDYNIILPLMVSCSVSTLVTKLVREESIYTLQLSRRGIDVRQREENIMQAFTVRRVMRKEVPTLRETASGAEILSHFLSSTLPVCFVVDEHQRLRGEISIHDIKELLREDSLGPLVVARDVSHSEGLVAHPEDTLAQCLENLARRGDEYLPVVNPATGVLHGMISQGDILALYQREILRHEYLGLSLRTERIRSTAHERVRLPAQSTVDVIPVPERYVGKTLREIGLRAQFAVTVVAIRGGGLHREDEWPDPGRVLGPIDYLVVVGTLADVRRFVEGDAAAAGGA
jgi:CIC family chloride channel protein